MLDYKVLWSDGRGAASRGGENDGHILTHIKVEEEKDMWKLAYLLRLANLTNSATLKNIPSIREELLDYGEFDEDDEYDMESLEILLNKDDFEEKDLDAINMDDIDGGEPWIISITLNGEEIYNCGWDEFEENEDFDW